MEQQASQSDSVVENSSYTPFLKKLTVFCAGGPFLDGYILVIIAAALVQMGPIYDLDAHWIGSIGAASFAGLFVGGIFVGYLTDLIGRKKMYTWDLLAFVILSLLMLIVQTPLQIVILRFLMGIAIGADYPIATALLTEYAPKRHRAFMLGILMAMFFRLVRRICG